MCQDFRVFKHFKTVLFIFSLITVSLGFNAYAAGQPQLSINSHKHKPDELLVKFTKETIASSQASAIAKSHGAAKVKSFRRPRQLSESPIDQWRLVKLNPGQNLEQAMQGFANDPDVEMVEPNYEVSINAYPNDPYFYDLWGMDNEGQTGGTYDADIDAPEAWDIYTGSNSVIVAVIDSGVDYNHEDLADNIWTNPGEIPGNGIDDDGNGYIDDIHGYDFVNNDGDPMDDFGHGTHCSGTIAAVGNNGIGVAGVSWNASIMGLKFLSYDGNGYTANAVSAVLYATDMGARVMSNSWGGGGFSQALLDAINAADAVGALFVAAAGNSNRDSDNTPVYPQGYDAPNVLSIAATDHNDNKASFSNYGATSVDLGAPGVDIMSTVPTGSCSLCNSTGYRYLSGTSMAAPHVSGAAALLLSLDSSLTPAELINILMATVDPLPALAGITVSGGRLNIYNALNAFANLQFAVIATPGVQTILNGESTTYTVTVKSFNGFSKPVTLSVSSPEPTISGVFSKKKVKPPADGTIDSILTVSTTSQTPDGSYTLTIQGANVFGETFTTHVTLVVHVPDFELSISPASRIIESGGGQTTYTVQLDSLYGYSAPVTLNFSTTDSNISGSFSLNPVTVPADGSITSTLTVTTTPSAPDGNFILTVEGSDGEITHTGAATLIVTGIDLVMTDVSTTAVSLSTGESFTISSTVKNQGTSPVSTSTYVGLYLSTDANITTSDRFLGNYSISSLGVGASYTYDATVDLPLNIAAGTYYIGAVVDTNNSHDEYDETNNSLAGNTIEVVSDVDLVITDVSTTAVSLYTGESFTISSTVKNQGTSSTSASSYVGLYLSTDANITTSDIYLWYWLGSGLAPGESATYDKVVKIPAGLAAGTYYIGAIADYLGAQDESDETNNSLAGGTIEVLAGIPDLVMTDVSTTAVSVVAGTDFIISSTIKNQGASPATAQYLSVLLLLSTDTEITLADDTWLPGYWVVSLPLAAGASETYDATVTVPVDMAVGTYYIGAIADWINLQDETDETNNSLAGSTIEVTSP